MAGARRSLLQFPSLEIQPGSWARRRHIRRREVTVTVNAKSIRAERYVEIGAIVRRDRHTLIERWAGRAAEEQPNAARVHHAALVDHLPDFLRDLAANLEHPDPDGDHHRRSALIHGEQRWEGGWSLSEVIRDYRILRLVVLEIGRASCRERV